MSNQISQFMRKGELSELTSQALRLQKLQILLQEILPSELAEHCRAISMANHCIILEVPSSSIATVLRYHIPAVLSALRQHIEFASIASIKAQVKPLEAVVVQENKAKPRPHAGYSQKTRDLLAHMADRIEYEPLKAALRKLSEHL